MRCIVIEIPDGVKPEDMDKPVGFISICLAQGETSGEFGDGPIRWSVEEMD